MIQTPLHYDVGLVQAKHGQISSITIKNLVLSTRSLEVRKKLYIINDKETLIYLILLFKYMCIICRCKARPKLHGGFTAISGTLGGLIDLEVFAGFLTSKSSKSLSHSFSSLTAITSLSLQRICIGTKGAYKYRSRKVPLHTRNCAND